MTLAEAARRIGVTPDTLRRWVRRGLVPQFDGEWTPSAVGAARVVTWMRERGHSLAEIQRATDEGRLAFGFLEELFPADQARISIRDAAREARLERIGEVRLKGFSESTEVFVARQREDAEP